MDRLGRSPLHYASLSNDASEVAILLASGSDPNVSDKRGHTPLHLQRNKGHSTQRGYCSRTERTSIEKMQLESLRLEPLCSTRAARVTSFNYCAQMVQTLGRPTTLAKVRLDLRARSQIWDCWGRGDS